MSNEKQLAILAAMAKGWFGNSQQHSVHAEIIRQKGYHKLADKMQAETFAKHPQKKLKHITFQLFEIFLII